MDSLPSNQILHKIQPSNLFSPRSPLEFIGFSFITAMLGLMSAGNWLGLLFIPIFATGWWLFDRHRDQKRLQATSFVVSKEAPRPARGLILLLSPYAVRGNTALTPTELEPHLAHLLATPHPTDNDFTNIGLLSSNLLPQIRAIDYHLSTGKLQEVWLIATASYSSVEGSAPAATILQKYLQHQHGDKAPHIHQQQSPIKEYDYISLWQLAETIFRDSAYKDEVLVADITGGNKMMSIALAMACIPPGRRMQYMDTRDWQGNLLPTGNMTPIAVDIDSILYPETTN